jgi:hypothetical protein
MWPHGLRPIVEHQRVRRRGHMSRDAQCDALPGCSGSSGAIHVLPGHAASSTRSPSGLAALAGLW